MDIDSARQILHALLAEKGIAVPGEDGDTRELLRLVLSPEASGPLSPDLCRALAETLDAVAAATGNTASGDGAQY